MFHLSRKLATIDKMALVWLNSLIIINACWKNFINSKKIRSSNSREGNFITLSFITNTIKKWPVLTHWCLNHYQIDFYGTLYLSIGLHFGQTVFKWEQVKTEIYWHTEQVVSMLFSCPVYSHWYTAKPLLSGHPSNSHPYLAVSNQSPDEGFSIVFTSIKWPVPFKRPLSIFARVAV